ncbi:hypothetical protein IGI04_022011, partial [Brassica rapa subsp. trilocularis]
MVFRRWDPGNQWRIQVRVDLCQDDKIRVTWNRQGYMVTRVLPKLLRDFSDSRRIYWYTGKIGIDRLRLSLRGTSQEELGRSCRGSKTKISPFCNIQGDPHEEGEIQENVLRSVQKGDDQITKPIPSVAQLETNLAQTDPTEVIMNFVEMENGLVLANKALEVDVKVLDEDVMEVSEEHVNMEKTGENEGIDNDFKNLTDGEEKDKSLDGASGVAEKNNSIENVDQLKKGKKLWEQFVIVDFFVSNVLVSSLSIFVLFFIFSLFFFGLIMLVSSLSKMKLFPLISIDTVWWIFIGAVSHWCLVFIWNLRGRFGVTWSHCFDINFLVVLVATHGSLAASQFLCLASSTQLQRSSFDITTVMELFFMVAQVDDMVSIKLDVYHSPVVITILSEQMRSTYDVCMVYLVNGKSFRKGNNSVTDLSGRGAERTWCLVYVNWFSTDYFSYNALEFDFGNGLYFLIQTILWKWFSLVWRLSDIKGRGFLQIRLRSDGMRRLTMLLLMCLASLSQTQTLLKYTEKTVMGVDYGCKVFQMMLIGHVSDVFVKLKMF